MDPPDVAAIRGERPVGAEDATLERARAALARFDWPAAYSMLAGTAEASGPEAQAVLAEAAWWLGQLDECITAREQAYARFERAGEGRAAARMAMLLYDDQCFKGRRAVARGWLQRAKRLLEAEPACLERGQLLTREAEVAHGEADLERAIDRARQALELGRALGDADLVADALQCTGRLLIAAGRPAEGLAFLDEAMLSVAEGTLGPFATGKVYCSLISACEELGDYQRALEWTDVGARWSEDHPSAVFPGLCRVHRAELLQLKGAWAEAEEEARRACTELCDVHLFNAGAGFYGIGEVRRRLGDLDEAQAAFRRAEEMGFQPQPGLALLRLAEGRVDAAAAEITRTLSEEPWDRLRRAKLLPAYVEIVLAAHDVESARIAVEELDAIAAEYRTPGLSGAALLTRGRLALAEGDVRVACGTLRQALHEWEALDLPYEMASTRVLLGLARREAGDEDGARASLDAAVALFQRLGAGADAGRARALREDGDPASLPAGLTAREAEVLRLVATGLTNRDVAGELFLSEKTVARHLSNLFVKIAVSSRAAATAWAFEHGIVSAHVPRDHTREMDRTTHAHR